jgi:hypothetical protein
MVRYALRTMASFRNSLLQTLLIVAAASPAVGCGGETTEDTSTAGGAGGSSSGSSGQSGAAGTGTTGGTAGTGTTGGTAGTGATGGAGGASTGGTGGVSTGGSAGAVSTGGAAGAATGGASGTGGVGGVSTGGAAGAGGAATGGSAGASTGGAAGAGGSSVCEGETPVTVGNSQAPTGLVRCGNGALLRVEPIACPNLIDPAVKACDGGGPGSCTTSADCTAKPNGWCGSSFEAPCGCQYGCVQDSDCASDELCQCGDPVGRCVKASCKSSADCAGGCAQYETGLAGCGTQGFSCLTPDDACVSNDQCQTNGQGGLCHVDNPGDPRKCEPYNCAVGRPLVVEQGWRLAALQASSAWG